MARINEISFKIPSDLVEQSKKITEEMNEKLRRYGVAKVDFVSSKPLDKQIVAEAWTDMDSTICGRSKGQVAHDTGWREFEAAIAKRAQYLKEHGYAKEINGKLVVSDGTEQLLKDKELIKAGAKLEQRYKRFYESSKGIQELNGVYRGHVKLHSGKHAVVTTGQKVTLIPYQGRLKTKVGQEINVQLTKKGVFRIRSREMGLSL